jgi:hypothetical protein
MELNLYFYQIYLNYYNFLMFEPYLKWIWIKSEWKWQRPLCQCNMDSGGLIFQLEGISSI